MSANLFRRVQRAGERAALLRKDDPRIKSRRIKEIIASFTAASKNKSNALPDMSRLSDAELLQAIGTDEANYPRVMNEFIHCYKSARAEIQAKGQA